MRGPLVALLLCLSATAAADGLAVAKGRFRRGDYAGALAEYRRLAARPPEGKAAVVHWGVGRSLEMLGRYREAAEAFERCLVHTRAEARRARVRRKVAAMEAQLGDLEVACAPGVEVTVGLWRGGCPARLRRLDPGPLQLEATLDGRRYATVTIDVRAGRHTHIKIPTPGPLSGARPVDAPSAEGPPIGPWAVGLAGVGLAFAGGALLILAESDARARDEAYAEYRATSGRANSERIGRLRADAEAAATSARHRRGLGWTSLGLGAALGVSGLVWGARW